MKPKSIEEAANMVASNFQIKATNNGEGPIEALAQIGIELPYKFPNDWRACDFISLLNLIQEYEDE